MRIFSSFGTERIEPRAILVAGMIVTFPLLGIAVVWVTSLSRGPMLLSLLLLGIVVGLSLVKRPVVGLMLWAFTLSFQQQWTSIWQSKMGLGSPSQIAGAFVLLFMAVNWRSLVREWTADIALGVRWAFLLTVLGLVAVMRWPDELVAGPFVLALYGRAVVLLTYVAWLSILTTSRQVRFVLAAYVAGQAVIAALSVRGFLGMPLPEMLASAVVRLDVTRAAGGYYDPNVYAISLLPLCAFAMAAISDGRRIQRLLGAGLLVLGMAGVAVSLSLAGYLAVAAMAMAWLFRTRRSGLVPIAAGILALGWVGSNTGLMNLIIKRALSLQQRGFIIGNFLSDHGRLRAWNAWLYIALTNPLGLGINYLMIPQIARTVLRRFGHLTGPHNLWLGVWVEMGPPGLLALLAVVFLAVRSAVRLERGICRINPQLVVPVRFSTLLLVGLGVATMAQEAYLYKIIWVALAFPLMLEAVALRSRPYVETDL